MEALPRRLGVGPKRDGQLPPAPGRALPLPHELQRGRRGGAVRRRVQAVRGGLLIGVRNRGMGAEIQRGVATIQMPLPLRSSLCTIPRRWATRPRRHFPSVTIYHCRRRYQQCTTPFPTPRNANVFSELWDLIQNRQPDANIRPTNFTSAPRQDNRKLISFLPTYSHDVPPRRGPRGGRN